jgi:hypothetical protein
VNLVGTGVLDCSKATDPGACYTQPFVRYQLTHSGAPWITDAEQSWTILPMPSGNIEGAKALAAEQWLDPIVNAWSEPYVASVARSELSVRPLGGSYEIQFDLGPEVVLERIQRVQLLLGTSYWVSQGQPTTPPAPTTAGSPTIAHLNYTQGDRLGGGKSIVITGTDLGTVTSCMFGGAPATITGQTSMTLTVTLPARAAAGVVDVVVTSPTGSATATGAFEYWSPWQLTPSRWWRPSYAGPPWLDNVGDVPLTSVGADPTTGAAVNGFVPASSDGTKFLLDGTDIWTSLLDPAGYAHWALFNAPAAVAPGAQYDPSIWGDIVNGDQGMAFTTNGVQVWHTSSSAHVGPAPVAAIAGAWHLAVGRYDGTNLRLDVDGTAGMPTAVPPPTLRSSAGLVPFANYGGYGNFAGSIMELGFAKSFVSDADVVKLRKYCNQKWLFLGSRAAASWLTRPDRAAWAA